MAATGTLVLRDLPHPQRTTLANADVVLDLVDAFDTEELIDPDAEDQNQAAAPAEPADAKPNVAAPPANTNGAFAGGSNAAAGPSGGLTANGFNAQGNQGGLGEASALDRIKPSDMPDEGSVLVFAFLKYIGPIHLASHTPLATRRQHQVPQSTLVVVGCTNSVILTLCTLLLPSYLVTRTLDVILIMITT